MLRIKIDVESRRPYQCKRLPWGDGRPRVVGNKVCIITVCRSQHNDLLPRRIGGCWFESHRSWVKWDRIYIILLLRDTLAGGGFRLENLDRCTIIIVPWKWEKTRCSLAHNTVKPQHWPLIVWYYRAVQLVFFMQTAICVFVCARYIDSCLLLFICCPCGVLYWIGGNSKWRRPSGTGIIRTLPFRVKYFWYASSTHDS